VLHDEGLTNEIGKIAVGDARHKITMKHRDLTKKRMDKIQRRSKISKTFRSEKLYNKKESEKE